MENEIRAFLTSLEAQPSYSLSTRQAYSSDLRQFMAYLETLLQRQPTMEDITHQRVAGYFELEQQNGRRKSTLLRRRAALRRFSQYVHKELFDWDGVLAPLATSPALLDQSEDLTMSTVLSQEQITQLLATFDRSPRPLAQRDKAIVAVLLETCLSVSALIELDLTDLDLRAGVIRISSGLEKEVWAPLGSALGPITHYIKEIRPELNPPLGEPALFISQVGTRMSRQSVWQSLSHWGRLAELPLHLSPRVIRHTAAVNSIRSGKPLDVLQAMLGHTNRISTLSLVKRLGENRTHE